MQRPSQQDVDGITWATAPLPLGTVGLDLRQPSDPGSLAKLLNARFRDARTVERRTGHGGVLAQDSSNYPGGAPTGWRYGHGQVMSSSAHFPEPRQAKGTFQYGQTDLLWTGDRILIMRDGPALGQHPFWGRGSGTQKYGIPAYLPVQTESAPQDMVAYDYADACLTQMLRVVVGEDENDDCNAWVIDRETGALINHSVMMAGTVTNTRVINSGEVPVALWMNGTDLYLSWWSGSAWTTPTLVAASISTYEIVQTPTGFLLAWLASGVIHLGHYAGHTTDNSVFNFNTTLSLPYTPAGAFALAIAPNGSIGVVWQESTGLTLYATTVGDNLTDYAHLQISTEEGAWNSGIAACFRSFEADDRYNLVVHAGNGEQFTQIWELYHTVSILYPEMGPPVTTVTLAQLQTDKRYRSKLASKSFRVGDEVFCWLQAQNAMTNYLVAGVTMPQVSGICDREVAVSRVEYNTGSPGFGVKFLPLVTPDPLSPTYNFSWVRPYNAGTTYARPGNARIGDLDFMPELSAVQYGDSVYLAGSHVRNWDGVELGDAGFHDYPKVTGIPSQTTGGSLTLLGTYSYRIYAVRYNRQGERFQSSAVTVAPIVLTGSNNKLNLVILTVPCTNHDDVVFEVYRTESLGTTYYLEGTIANDLSAEYVNYASTIDDADLRDNEADPHETGIAGVDEVEEMGPIGCRYLAVAGDRLWGFGGQVPRGYVQFSKLKEPGEGVGFDALAGTQEVDSEGGDITAFVGYNDSFIAFERDKLYVLFGAGPNNYGIGAFSTPQIVLADGAVSPYLVVVPPGVVYWGVDGPRLLTPGFRVENISSPVRKLSSTLTLSGVRSNVGRQEVVFYTADGTALLWNYLTGSRWAQWTGLYVAGCSQGALATVDGVLLTEAEHWHDAGVPYAFVISSSHLRPEEILQGHTQVRRCGMTGEFHDSHDVRFRIFYDGAPLWSEQFEWEPETETYLTALDDVSGLTPDQVDALVWSDKSGAYDTNKRLKRQTCNFFRVEISDIGGLTATFTPFELTFELGRKPGLGRTAINTFRD